MNKPSIALLLLTALLLAGAAVRTHADQAAPDPAGAVAPERLTQGALSAPEYAFKQEVYRRHVARGLTSGRPRVFDLPSSALAPIPGTQTLMRRDAAAALGRLLGAARADLTADLDAPGQDAETTDRRERARRVEALALDNAYRSASTQFGIWDRNYAEYAASTRAARLLCPGGEFGPAAADLLREYVGVRVAAPGFSNHQGGTAVDFALRLQPAAAPAIVAARLGPSAAQADPWKESWFWRWLNRRAGAFGFIAYLPEPWHWEFAPDRAGKGRS